MNRNSGLFNPLKSRGLWLAGAARALALLPAVALAMSAGLSACSQNAATVAPVAPSAPVAVVAVSSTIDQTQQSAFTPDSALARLQEGNQRYVSGNTLVRDYPAQVKATASGQYPFAAVLSCMDSRSPPELVFDQGIGDLFVVRIAGNYAQPDVMGSLEYATKVAGAKLIVVLGHTECGAIKGACDNVQLGNLTTVIQALRPTVEAVDYQGDRTSKNKKFVMLVTEANVRRTVAKLRADSPILNEMEQSGQIKIVGGILDVSTGQVKFYDWESPSTQPG